MTLGQLQRAELASAVGAGPILDRFRIWLEQTLPQSPPRSALAKAICYTLNRWRALVREDAQHRQ